MPQELWCEEGEEDGTVDEGDGAEDHDGGGELTQQGNTWLMEIRCLFFSFSFSF